MIEPDFGQKKRTTLTFDEDSYFEKIDENVALITDRLQLGREEAGVLDKKINPDILHTIGKVIDLLHVQDYMDDAERELAVQSNPDVAIAILRQAFRIHSGRVNDILVRKLTDLCQLDGDDIAREAIREATGSELQRLSQLADEVFLNMGTESELQQVAVDFHRTLNIRIRACRLLIKRHRCVDAVPVAFNLFVDGSKKPSARNLLSQLSKCFGALETIDSIQKKVIMPLLDYLQSYQKDTDIRRYLLKIVRELYKPVLAYIRETPVWQIQRGDMWLALTLRECAIQSPAGTQLMLDWLGNREIDDYFRLRLSRRIKHNRVKFPRNATSDLESLINEFPYQYEDEMQENVNEALANSKGVSESRKPIFFYAELLKQYQETGNVEDQDLWDFRFTSGGLNYLQSKSKEMSEGELELLLQIIYDEKYKAYGDQRINIIFVIYPKLTFEKKGEALRIIYNLAQNEPRTSKPWQRANKFLVQLIDEGDNDSELARQYWKKLGKQ